MLLAYASGYTKILHCAVDHFDDAMIGYLHGLATDFACNVEILCPEKDYQAFVRQLISLSGEPPLRVHNTDNFCFNHITFRVYPGVAALAFQTGLIFFGKPTPDEILRIAMHGEPPVQHEVKRPPSDEPPPQPVVKDGSLAWPTLPQNASPVK